MPRRIPTHRIPTNPVSRFDYLRHYKPESLFIPRLIGLIKNKPNDRELKSFLRKARIDSRNILDNYETLESSKKRDYYGRDYHIGESYNKSFKELLTKTSIEYKEKITIENLRKKEAVRKKLIEFKDKSLYDILQIKPEDSFELIAQQKYIRNYWRRLVPCCELSGGEDKPPTPVPPPTPPPKKYSFRINKMKCNEQEDWTGDDDIYFVSYVVDGNGKVTALQSPSWEMDTGQKRSIWWSVYPMQNPNNFLDIAVRMYEVNGSYDDISAALGALASAAGGINVYAGAALGILGGLAALIGALDDDDDLGTHGFTFNGKVNLHTSVGTHLRSYLGDDADYDVNFQLIEAQ